MDGFRYYLGLTFLVLFAIPFAVAANFGVGDAVQVYGGTLNVRSSPSLTGTILSTKRVGAQGSVLSGPTSAGGYLWWRIRWSSNSLEGYTVEQVDNAGLTKVVVTPSTNFAINDRVRVTESGVNIRSDPLTLSVIGSANAGMEGTIIGGPRYAVAQSITGFNYFWKVQFSGITGWLAEQYLVAVAGGSDGSGTGGSGTCDYPNADECYLLPTSVLNINYESGSRTASAINYIVIHTTGIAASFDEESVKSSFADQNHKASAHYLVTRTGKVIQFIRDRDVAYHAGNYAYNLQSIGIEHEGAATDSGVYTPAMAEASARLVRWLADQYAIPKDRVHIMGHSEVPCPCTSNCPGALPVVSTPPSCSDAGKHLHTPTSHTDCRYGGIAAKSDPGQYWNWNDYLTRIGGTAGLSAPMLSGPADGATLTTLIPSLTWGAVNGAVQYNVEIIETSSGASYRYAASGTSFPVPSGTLVYGRTYRWHIQSVASSGAQSAWSSEWRFITQNPVQPLQPPNRLNPADDTTVNTLTPMFGWEPVANAASYWITIHDQNNAVVVSTAVMGTSYVLLSPLLRDGQTYRWQMQSVNSFGGAGDWSSVWQFTVSTGSGGTGSSPTLLDPLNGAVLQTTTPTLRWGSVTGATQYNVYVEDMDTGQTLVSRGNGINLLYMVAPGVLRDGGNYRWRANTFIGTTFGPYSPYSSFIVRISVPIITPSAPQNLVAAAQAGSIDLNWQAPASDGGSPIMNYKLYRGTTAEQQSLLQTLPASLLAFSDSAVQSGVTYYYKVSAVNTAGAGEGTFSTTVSATVRAPQPQIPAIPTPQQPGTSSPPGPIVADPLTFSWSASADASWYKLHISRSPFGEVNIVYRNENVQTNTLPLPAGTLQQGTQYRWDVGACNGAVCSDQSSDRYFQIQENQPSADQTYNAVFFTDAQLEHYWSMTADEIRAFLTEKGSYFKQSVADVDGVSFDAATVIWNAAQQYRINPKTILVTMQKEQAAITSTRPSDYTMRRLTGCLAPSTARVQLTCAAERYRSYMDSLTANEVTVAGWAVGVAKMTQDGVLVTPVNKAIASLFTYTPLVGVQWGGNMLADGGNYLFYRNWNDFGFADDPITPKICPVTYRTNAVASGYRDGTWIAVNADADPELEGFGYRTSSASVATYCRSSYPVLTTTREGYAVRRYSSTYTIVCTPRRAYRYYRADSDARNAVLSTMKTEPYVSNGQELTAQC